MKHLLSNEDLEFKSKVEDCVFPVSEFDHRAHVRLAYVYLTENTTKIAIEMMRNTLLALLKHNNIDATKKFHETLTEAWILAVQHFMSKTQNSQSAEQFIGENPILLDSKIMFSHYSTDVLFSDAARKKFIQPNLDPIPRSDV